MAQKGERTLDRYDDAENGVLKSTTNLGRVNSLRKMHGISSLDDRIPSQHYDVIDGSFGSALPLVALIQEVLYAQLFLPSPNERGMFVEFARYALTPPPPLPTRARMSDTPYRMHPSVYVGPLSESDTSAGSGLWPPCFSPLQMGPSSTSTPPTRHAYVHLCA
ncbi:unnamed protein product [Heligmosomoides polygyrus]|uniref:Uncharacterized protein n=1 Tax=Heligmosomoides polygyrus TaxID=6339 RepID=A0A183FEQ6_HELPZ|nr:unnamed protein product [Heligmosomoides polygyrus]